MHLDDDSCYRALTTHDARFDGRFFVGVSSTGIYCRPVCTVRTPRRENCTFYQSAAAAEVAGYRPCLRCRPELAPGNATIDAEMRLAHAAVNLMEDGAMGDAGVEQIAAKVGVTSRHLRRVFLAQFGVSPIDYAQTQRLLLAKRLLTDTALPITEVALGSGFRSLRRFNTVFKDRYRMPPSRLRRDVAPAAVADTLSFELAYRPPYAFDAMLDFLRARAIEGVEVVTDVAYARTLRLEHRGLWHRGVIEVRRRPRKSALAIALSASFARVVPAVLARIKSAFDLGCDPSEIEACLGSLAAAEPGLRVPGAFDGFEIAVRAVVGQQITVRAARTMLGRLVRHTDCAVENPNGGLSYLFPTAAELARQSPDALARLGFTSARARTIVALSEAVANGDIALHPGADVEATIERLTRVPGVGPWTAHYIAMRALGWPDAFLANDIVVLKAMNETRPARALARSEAWRPWRAYAVMHLWRGSK